MQPPGRERLIAAAENVFARRGFHAATVPEIAAAAGVSVGLMYRYFKGKEELAVAIVDRDRDEILAAVEGLGATTADPQEALGLLLEGWIDVALADRRGCALVAEIGAEATRDGAIAAAAAAHDQAVIGAVAALVVRVTPHVDPVAVATLLVSALDGIVVRVAIDDAFDPRPAAQALRSTLPILLAPGAAR